MPKFKRTKRGNASYIRKIAKSVVAKNTETKSHFTMYTLADIPGTASTTIATSLVDLAAGNLESQRDGNKVHLTSVKYDLFFNSNGAAVADAYNSIRLIFYIPKQPDVLLGNSAAGWVNMPFNAPVDFDRFTVLKDMLITVNSTGAQCIRKQGYISFRNKGKRLGLPITYDGSSPTSCTKNRVCVYMVSDSNIPSHPQVNGYVRSFYKDV